MLAKELLPIICVLCVTSSALALDVQSAYIGKGHVYAQTNAGTPVLKPAPYIFNLSIRLTNYPALNNASYSQPRFPGTWNFISFSFNSLLPSLTQRSWSESAFDTAHPDGDYSIKLDTVHDGSRTNRLVLVGATYPPGPRISNYAAAQNIDPASDFTLQWNAIAGALATDLITFTVMDRTGIIFQTGAFPDAPSILDGTRTSVNLPAGTPAAGRVYLARLRYDRIVSMDRVSYPSEVGWAAYFASTDFYLSTTGADSNTAPRVIAHYPPNGAADVPTDAPLIWTFSKQMQRASGVYSTHVTDRTFFWTTDGRSFVGVPVTGHATNVTVTYVLQPWGGAVFSDLAGNPLFTDVDSEFQTGNKISPPALQPRLGLPTIVSNTARMLLHGESNRVYAVQYSTNLSNWSFFSTNVTLTGPSLVTHSAVSSTRQRFYRAMVLR